MEIQTNSATFTNCLDIVEKVLPIRSTMPVINNIYLEIKPGNLILAATNLEMFIRVSMPYDGNESGKILLPPKIVDIMRLFPTPDVNITIDWDNFRIEISGGLARFHLFGSDPADFPTVFGQEATNDKSIIIEQKILKKILKMVIFSASTEETRPAFNGVLINLDHSKLTFTASDTYRLAVKTVIDESWEGKSYKVLVPARTLREFLRITGESQNQVTLTYDKNMLSFQFDNIYFATRLLEEKYPDVSGVIPNKYLTRIIVDRKQLEESVTRANLLAEGKNQAVNFLIKEDTIEIKGSGQEGSMEESLTVEKEGEELELFVNSRYILDLIKVVDEEKTIIDFHGDGGPLIFRLPEDQDYLYLALPIKKFN
jgi:DNA polymerase III subunit beta